MFQAELGEGNVSPVIQKAANGVECSFELGEVLVPFHTDDASFPAEVSEDYRGVKGNRNVGCECAFDVMLDPADEVQSHIVVDIPFRLSAHIAANIGNLFEKAYIKV